MANIFISLILATYATNALLSHFITGLCISAGFSNPIGWAFLTLGLITVTVAGLINLLAQEGIYAISAVCNPDALCPEDAGRFKANGADLPRSIDRDRVQNVITAIHHEMEPRGFGGWRYSPFFRLQCLGNQGRSEKLDAIRGLRAEGKVDYQTTVAADTSLYFNTAMLKNH